MKTTLTISDLQDNEGNASPGDFNVLSMELTSEVNRPFNAVVSIESIQALDLRNAVGQEAKVTIYLPQNQNRYLVGYVDQIELAGQRIDDRYRYTVVVVPGIALLKHSATCRIFKNKRVDEVFAEVIRESGLPIEIESNLKMSDQRMKRPIITQYRETHLDFIHRLFEQHALYYTIDQSVDAQKLILCDSPASYEAFGPFESFDFNPDAGSAAAFGHVHEWTERHSASTVKHHVHETKSLASNRRARGAAASENPLPFKAERQEFPVFPLSDDEADLFANAALARSENKRHCIVGSANTPAIVAGHKFTLNNHPAGADGAEYYVTKQIVTMTCRTTEVSNEGGHPATEITNHVTAIPAAQAFQPALGTPSPTIDGVLLATVDGTLPSNGLPPFDTSKEGKDHGLKLGAVKITFEWDNAQQDVWAPVSQSWAGQGAGSFFYPLPGSKVLVAFLNGNPDYPKIVGRVYSDITPTSKNKPPVTLPQNIGTAGIWDQYGNSFTMTGPDNSQNIVIQAGDPHQSQINLGVQPNWDKGDEFIGADTKGGFIYGQTKGSLIWDAGSHINTVRDWGIENYFGFKLETFGGLHVENTMGVKMSNYLGAYLKHIAPLSWQYIRGMYLQMQTGGKGEFIFGNSIKFVSGFEFQKRQGGLEIVDDTVSAVAKYVLLGKNTIEISADKKKYVTTEQEVVAQSQQTVAQSTVRGVSQRAFFRDFDATYGAETRTVAGPSTTSAGVVTVAGDDVVNIDAS